MPVNNKYRDKNKPGFNYTRRKKNLMPGENGSDSRRRVIPPYGRRRTMVEDAAGAQVVVPDVIAGAGDSGQRGQRARQPGPRGRTQIDKTGHGRLSRRQQPDH